MTVQNSRYQHAQRDTESLSTANLVKREVRWAGDTRRLVGKLEDLSLTYEGGYSVRYLERFGSLAAALTAFSSTNIHLIVSTTVTLTANATIPENVAVEMKQGGAFARNGFTLTINGPFFAPRQHVFTGSGTVVFAAGACDELYPEWWGAAADDTSGGQTDNADPFNEALVASKAGIRVLLAPGEYGFLSGITMHERSHLVGTRKTRLWFYGSTAASPQTAIFIDGGTDGVNGDFNGGIENLEILQAGELHTGTAIYMEGSIPSVHAHNVQRIICRDISIQKFNKAMAIENVCYINAIYNFRVTNCLIGIYAKNAVNAVNFYGYYYDGAGASNSYGVQFDGDNDPSYYTTCCNFYGGAIENCEHSIYTDQSVPFTAQFYGTYFEDGDIDIQGGQLLMTGCSTQFANALYHIRIQGSLLTLQQHRFGGSLQSADVAAALVYCLGASIYIEEGRTLHQSIIGLTGRTNPKIYRDTATSYVRYWGIDAATGAEDGFVTEFGSSQRFRQAASDAAFLAYNKTDASRTTISSQKVNVSNALAATVGLGISNQADSQKVEIKSSGIDLTHATLGTLAVALGSQGSTLHLQLTRMLLTNLFRLGSFATAARPTTDLLTYAQINDSDLGQQLVYSGSGTIWRTQSRRWRILKTGVNMNNAGNDVASIIGLPAKYRVIKIMAFEASVNFSASPAAYDLRTASGGGGTAIVSGQTLTGLTAATRFADGTLAAFTADYCTATTLWIRNSAAHGSAATVSFLLEVEQLD